MRKPFMLLVPGMLVLSVAAAGDYSAEIAASRAMAGEFMQTLKQELMAGMQEGGPVNAISVCNLSAPAIANTYSVRNGWDVGRTSLRVRNPENAPDAWERSVLESFEQRKAQGEDPAQMEYHEVVQTGSGTELRYMKAIPTVELCLACHGTQVDSTVRERLAKLYPEDKATGFRVGDIRGAFSITQPLEGGEQEPESGQP